MEGHVEAVEQVVQEEAKNGDAHETEDPRPSKHNHFKREDASHDVCVSYPNPSVPYYITHVKFTSSFV